MTDPASPNFEFAALWEAKNYRKAIVEEFRSALKGHVLEVGGGIGQMSEAFQALPGVTELTCVEPDAHYAAEIRKRLPHARLHEGTVFDLDGAVQPDCIVSINVMEHIEADQAEMDEYARRLRPTSGFFCILTPARPELHAPIDDDFGHFRRYTKAELRGKLERAGFAVERIHYYNSLGYFAWLIGFKWGKARTFKVPQVRFYDRWLFPMVHTLEHRVLRPPFGQSLIAIAKAKP